ncbi:UDP-2,3-diacylglucosamine diphosphatase [Hydrogenophaga crocea]|uniref:UDP-2,3-diacylglucosamine hydrolase n=1 Tax=Hydrogenophaga crocea TaxID=2716225 RepID=A0A6G8IEG0_9BURK|nr:UDP-2,3-diacylglucosamine diphosphatase [Hydrogenophaga crocea]QIM51435.1 UDP-2,3-diacylglucosamine diphosphatase [Hydrogenophaga crocea]
MGERTDELVAPSTWRTVDLISDLHLQASEPATQRAWLAYLDAAPAPDALFILGDLFEVWVGDDVLDHADTPERAFVRDCVAALHRFSKRAALFFMAGNRDFLLGTQALAASGMRGLADPTVLAFGGQRWLLSHGDALCLADTDYLAFRAQVRGEAWQTAFLARPLAARETIAADLRARSEARKRELGHDPGLWADVDAAAARQALRAANAGTLIHGHTHRPAEHALGDGLRRLVLSDWDLQASPPRAEVLRLTAAGARRVAL